MHVDRWLISWKPSLLQISEESTSIPNKSILAFLLLLFGYLPRCRNAPSPHMNQPPVNQEENITKAAGMKQPLWQSLYKGRYQCLVPQQFFSRLCKAEQSSQRYWQEKQHELAASDCPMDTDREEKWEGVSIFVSSSISTTTEKKNNSCSMTLLLLSSFIRHMFVYIEKYI